jgi:hypothetical protein
LPPSPLPAAFFRPAPAQAQTEAVSSGLVCCTPTMPHAIPTPQQQQQPQCLRTPMHSLCLEAIETDTRGVPGQACLPHLLCRCSMQTCRVASQTAGRERYSALPREHHPASLELHLYL